MACVAGLEREKGAVAAVPGLDQHDAAVGDQFGAGVRSHADKGISVGTAMSWGPVGTGNSVVVVRAGEATVSGDDLLVKLAHVRILPRPLAVFKLGQSSILRRKRLSSSLRNLLA